MCQIISVPAGKRVNLNNLDKAQEHNKDGYGVAWYEDGKVKTYKTMHYNTFKKVLKALTPYTKIVHLRYSTVGQTTLENCHPFPVPTGAMFHNGTITSLSPKGKMVNGKWEAAVESDSKMLADILMDCWYENISDIEPLLKHIIGTTINKLAFLDDKGTVTIINEHLGVEEDGIWYSNDYHIKDEGWCRHGYCAPKKNKPSKKTTPPATVVEEGKTSPLSTVFVYGTLKKGFSNHIQHLGKAEFVGKASTISRWTMIGKGRGFPYVVEMDHSKGHNIKGEVYRVTPEELARLDRLEGVAHNHYKKVFAYVRFDDGTTEPVTMYVAYNKPFNYEGSEYLEEWVG